MINSKQDLINFLNNEPKINEEEQADHDRILDAISGANGDIFENTTLPGHVTVSGFVCSEDLSTLLLIKHNKLGMWMQPGGHSDGNHNTVDECIREVTEETGLKAQNITLFQEEPINVDIHDIPKDVKRGLGQHHHLDVQYVFTCNPEDVELNKQESEIYDISWFTLDEILEKYNEAKLGRVIEKIRELKNT